MGGQSHAPTGYPLCRTLSGPRGGFGHVRKILTSTGFRTPNHPAGSVSLYRLSYTGRRFKYSRTYGAKRPSAFQELKVRTVHRGRHSRIEMSYVRKTLLLLLLLLCPDSPLRHLVSALCNYVVSVYLCILKFVPIS